MTEKEIILLLSNRYLKIIGFNRNQHLRNKCLEIINSIEKIPEGKANRILGYVRKCLIDLKFTTHEKEHRFERISNFYNEIEINKEESSINCES